ncbi:hypothetical protein DDI_2764 [Dickeya dianthicola RNS04.9]|nr:hypothetical protein DDI_2764 [Dickeya dianthicola RNS04.9]
MRHSVIVAVLLQNINTVFAVMAMFNGVIFNGMIFNGMIFNGMIFNSM